VQRLNQLVECEDMHPATHQDLDRVFHALADTTRRAMLRQMSKGEKTVSQLAQPHELTLAAISKHLKVLESADLIRRRKSGSFQMITLNPEALKSAEQWLGYYEKFWSSRMGRLKNLLETSEEKP
jgi:DNA-binding transcriptional ArsR family regulator